MRSAVPLMRADDTSGRVHDVLAAIDSEGIDMPILRAVANAEPLFPSFVRYARALMREGRLRPRLRELVILRAAERLGSSYEWTEHEPFALAAGVTATEVSVLAGGTVPESVDGLERLSLQVVDALIDELAGRSRADDALLRRLLGRLGPDGYTELALVLGWWAGCVPHVSRALFLDATDNESPRPPSQTRRRS